MPQVWKLSQENRLLCDKPCQDYQLFWLHTHQFLQNKFCKVLLKGAQTVEA